MTHKRSLVLMMAWAMTIIGCSAEHSNETVVPSDYANAEMSKRNDAIYQNSIYYTDRKEVDSITQAEVLNYINNPAREYTLIDMRLPEDYAMGHIDTAVNIPYEKLLARPDILYQFKGKPIIIYHESGVKAGRINRHLEMMNHKSGIYHLQGDIYSWRRSGLPVVQL